MRKKTFFLLCTFISSLVTTAQIVTTFAGSTLGFTDGIGTSAQFYYPYGVATDSQGNVYVADSNNHKIRKITPTGEVSTVAGSTQGFANGAGVAAQFNTPSSVAIDNAGNLYVTDSGNSKIRKITPSGDVSTLAGTTAGFADGAGTVAQFNNPFGVATDSSGIIYVGDYFNHKIRKITPLGFVTTLAGSTQGFAEGTGAAAKFNRPAGVATDLAGNVYVADSNNGKIRKITPVGVVSTIAGSTLGFADGAGATAQFYYPQGVATDATNNVYVADTSNHKIRKITPTGEVSTLAGSTNGFANATGTTARFYNPEGIATDATGNVYVADWGNHKIRKIATQLSIAQNELASKITIYPNPASTVFNIQIEKGLVFDKIIIADLSGKVILNQTENITTINVENLAKGIYVFEVYIDEMKFQTKFIKE